MADKVHHDDLDLLHEICDGGIAHIVELVIQVCCANIVHKCLDLTVRL